VAKVETVILEHFSIQFFFISLQKIILLARVSNSCRQTN